MRFVYNSVDDLKRITDLSDEEIAISDFGTNTVAEYLDDFYRLSSYRTDIELSEIMVTQSLDVMAWMRGKGVPFVPNYTGMSVMVEGRRKFLNRMPLEVLGGGEGLVRSLNAAADKAGIEISYETRAVSLIYDGRSVMGVRAQKKGKFIEFRAKSVVLACGGFEANPEWRARYLGPGWELAKVRGSRFNQGDGLRMALDIGAAPYGNWSGCHATGWDRYAPEFGDLKVGNQFEKHTGVNSAGFLKTAAEFNAAVRKEVPFNPACKDGKCTVGIEPPKTNWAQPLDTPTFEAYAQTCGITFTFGGLRIDGDTGQVLNVHLHKIPGLYCAGEMVGGLYYFNYPGAAGLVSDAVFGCIAGRIAAISAIS